MNKGRHERLSAMLRHTESKYGKSIAIGNGSVINLPDCNAEQIAERGQIIANEEVWHRAKRMDS